ncbi:hypothetical protein AVEN_222067-1 [Araneus ventricosus]|uniref:Uncharacterized protein n=1 Tax=Araneus ventricosus TaxID=182803 RepID=A0A4Y2V0D5_ARAVE|nr:hypothetical protein AVEN_222067-1 [Araneus ventricosus]
MRGGGDLFSTACSKASGDLGAHWTTVICKCTPVPVFSGSSVYYIMFLCYWCNKWFFSFQENLVDLNTNEPQSEHIGTEEKKENVHSTAAEIHFKNTDMSCSQQTQKTQSIRKHRKEKRKIATTAETEIQIKCKICGDSIVNNAFPHLIVDIWSTKSASRQRH